jgi:exosome complex component RRP40
VIGQIKQKFQDNYLVDIGGTDDAILNLYDFDGVTKKNRPNLAPGALVYARVIEISPYLHT